MSNEERGMMKYAPYQSLVEHGKALAKLRQEKQRTVKRILLEDEVEEINEILVHYQGEPVCLVYFRNGLLHEESGTIQRIDAQNRRVQINDAFVSFSEFQSLKRK